MKGTLDYDPPMPRDLSKEQLDLIETVADEHSAMRHAERFRNDSQVRRTAAIAAAKKAGIPLTAIAERLGVSLERIRQMEKA